MKFESQHVLVTGAAGFIGNALARRLAQYGCSVRAIVREARLRSPAAQALADAGVTLIPGDVRDRQLVEQSVRGCTHVYHLAAQKPTPGTTAKQYFEVNVQATRHLAESARAEGVQRFVYASTLGVHGFVTQGVIDELSPVRPNSKYRHSKWLAEEVLRALHRDSAFPVVLARISSVVGPGARWWLPLIRGIAQERIKLIGNGRNHVDLVASDDIVDGLIKCASVPGIEGRCYVLGSASSTRFRAFAEAIARAAGAAPPGNGPPAAPYRAALRLHALLYRATGMELNGAHHREVLVANKVASSARARAELGYAPSHSVSDAVAAMVAHCAANGDLHPVRR